MSQTHHCSHAGDFSTGNPIGERATRIAVILTLVVMVAEITGGWYFGSMALLADGWHMSSHALALGLSVLAWRLSARFAHDPRFSFGAWRFEVLGGYTSALILLGVALLMAWESLARLSAPRPIHYDEAIAVAVVGLLTNLVCAWLLRDQHDHSHEHHAHADHEHADLNLRAAYLHVLADAATSVLAILALLAGRLWGADWLDPVIGIVGALLVGSWALGLQRQTGLVLLDAEMDAPVVEEIREVIAASPVPARIRDLHVWRIGKGQYACILGLELSGFGRVGAEYFRNRLRIHEELVHVTVELQHTEST
ncbi:MAG: cation transporter [Candidatus Dactylopiibacterium carminicum]|uniref:Cation transporter n=2 Tax=Candidatus Dactylopiibacterium carminicum TaxID=857335 RepID=A0A272EW37_9RHOO|nr:cation transporter [Candidatus Dactylopiibacterium carminicum]PAS94319.1 MAG: cation transporter [Candidatus Dactylopiibacterium carminicum]PAS98513.1 MAG: cation transporter [Candidatus Dactylopiibacterium carminicum]